MKTSLCIITKNCAVDLERALNNTKGKFDEICVTDTGSTDNTVGVAKKHGAIVSYFKWTGKYEDARNYNFSQAIGDWIVWMDSDDTIRGLENLLKFIKEADPLIGGVACRYEYSKDINGNVSTIHWKERAVRNGWFHWVSSGGLHEGLAPLKNCLTVHNIDAVWEHHKFIGLDKDEETRERNLRILFNNLGGKPKANSSSPDIPKYAGSAPRANTK